MFIEGVWKRKVLGCAPASEESAAARRFPTRTAASATASLMVIYPRIRGRSANPSAGAFQLGEVCGNGTASTLRNGSTVPLGVLELGRNP